MHKSAVGEQTQTEGSWYSDNVAIYISMPEPLQILFFVLKCKF